MAAIDFEAERAALAHIVDVVGGLLVMPRAPSFLDDVAARWEASGPAPTADAITGVAYDLVLLHVATMTNLFAALGWTIAYTVLADVPPERIGDAAQEAIRLGQCSIMLREVLKPITFNDGNTTYEIDRGVQLATMLPLTNRDNGRDDFDLDGPASSKDVGTTTFGHGPHRCPAQRFSMQTITRTVNALRANYTLTPHFDEVTPLPMQIGGVARPANDCLMTYARKSHDGR
jgi:cytochrome P450